MIKSPVISICVPSRNRQIYFQQTIRDLIRNPRPDIEFVFADNSDDPGIMNAFMEGIADRRIRYLPSLPETLPMQDNWERTMQATTGAWIVFIGDDDFVDSNVIDVIRVIEAHRPFTEVVAWNRLTFKWPDYRPFKGNVSVSLKAMVQSASRTQLIKDLFRWEGASHVPAAPFTIYHGAVARSAMERVKANYGGRYFEHPTVDFDCAAKLLHSAKEFVYISRPISVLGATASSNSAAVGRFSKALENYETFVKERGHLFETDEFMIDFPFKSNLGVACSILSSQHWFKNKYGVTIDGWEENFVQALSKDCSQAIDRESFDSHVELCRRAISAWRGGRFLPDFRPQFHDRAQAGVYTGLSGTNLMVNEDIGQSSTPAELYSIVTSVVPLLAELTYHIAGRTAS